MRGIDYHRTGIELTGDYFLIPEYFVSEMHSVFVIFGDRPDKRRRAGSGRDAVFCSGKIGSGSDECPIG